MSARHPDFVTCSGCGTRLHSAGLRFHVCDWWGWLDHQVQLHNEGLARFERDLGAYLESPSGRFELWCAEQERQTR